MRERLIIEVNTGAISSRHCTVSEVGMGSAGHRFLELRLIRVTTSLTASSLKVEKAGLRLQLPAGMTRAGWLSVF